MQQLIRNLDDATAIRALRTFSAARSRHGDFQTEWSAALGRALAEQVAGAVAPVAVSEGELAREALGTLAADPANRGPLAALICGEPAERFLDTGTIALGVAALIVLQTYVKIEWKDGKFSLKIEKKPLPTELIKKLIGFFG